VRIKQLCATNREEGQKAPLPIPYSNATIKTAIGVFALCDDEPAALPQAETFIRQLVARGITQRN
jgi:hypothetical protein